MKHRIFKVVSQVMKVPLERVNEDSSHDNIPKWDSIQHMNLVMALEEEFKVSFSDVEIIEMMSVKKIMEVIFGKNIA